MESPMIATARAILFGLWLAEQSMRNDGFDLAEAFERGQEIGIPGTVYDSESKSSIAVPDLLKKAYDAMRIGITDEHGEYAVIHDGTDNYIHTAGWWPVLEAINLQHCRLKPFLPDDPAERLDVFCEQIRNADGGYSMPPVLECLTALGVPDHLDGYRIPDGQVALDTDFNRNVCLSHAANNSSACIDGTDTLKFSTGLNYYCVEDLSEPMIKACQALIARRKRLYLSCVDTLV